MSNLTINFTRIFQLFAQFFNLHLELSQQRIFRILVHSCPVFDVFGSVCITQRAYGFIIIIICRSYISTLEPEGNIYISTERFMPQK